MSERNLTGQHYHYYSICKTKLWYHHHRLLYAEENEYVKLGKLIDEQSFERKNKEKIGSSQIDFIDKDGVIEVNEVKKSSTYKDADKIQLFHYMALLEDEGKNNSKTDIIGRIRYPEERNTEKVEWSEKNRRKYKEITDEIQEIINGECPPPEWKNACKKCSMREFCFA